MTRNTWARSLLLREWNNNPMVEYNNKPQSATITPPPSTKWMVPVQSRRHDGRAMNIKEEEM
jgi:hypothetical protein